MKKVMVWHFVSENSHEVMTALMVSCYFQIAVVKIDCACNDFIDLWKVCCDCIRLHCFAGWWTWLAFIKEGVLRLKFPVWTVSLLLCSDRIDNTICGLAATTTTDQLEHKWWGSLHSELAGCCLCWCQCNRAVCNLQLWIYISYITRLS
jgi:hypothetical protein